MTPLAHAAPAPLPASRTDCRSPRPVRVLLACDHIDHDGALHGAGRQLVELTMSLDPARVQTTTCVLRPRSPLGRQLQHDGVPLLFLGRRSWNPLHLWTLVRLIRRQNVDVLHLTDFGASTWGRLAGLITGTPAIVHVRSHHSEYQPRGYPWFVRLGYRILAPLTARAIAISDSVRDFAIQRMGFRAEQLELLNDPLATFSFGSGQEEEATELRTRYGLAPEVPVIGAVTRFHAAKGICFLVGALPAVLREVPNAHLVLVGAGPEEDSLREQSRALGVEDRVIFAGFQRDVATCFRMFALSVVPSLEEGFGNVAVESLALGVPVVASRSGGLPEIVSDGENGFLVEPGDSAGIAEAILSLLRDPELRARMSDAAHASSQRFLMSNYLDRLEAVYRTAANLPSESES